MTNIILCDDNKILLERYKNKIKTLAAANNINIHLSTFSNGESLIFYASEDHRNIDIIYLDVVMDNINGIETGKKLRELGCDAEIIFLTSSEEFVFDSFEISPLHYIIKDSSQENARFDSVFFRAIEIASKKKNKMFICQNKSALKKIPLHNISYFEIRGRVTTVHFLDETFEFYSSIDNLEKELNDKQFIRCHRSFIVNIHKIESISSKDILLSTKEIIPVGATYAKAVKLAISEQLMESI